MAALPLTLRRVELRWYPLAVASLVIVGGVLRLWNLGAHYLSYDEAFTWLVAKGPLPALVAATAGDVHPPLSYIIVWAFTHLVGLSAVTLRLPGALMGIAALPLVLALARRVGLSRAATLAGLALFALSPFQIHYSQDARMYPLLQLAVLAAVIGALDRRWWLMGAGLTVALWTHNYGLFYTAVIGLLALGRELRLPVLEWRGLRLVKVADLRAVVLAVVVPVILWLPWAAALRFQMQVVQDGYWILPLSLGQALYPVYTLLWGVTMPQELAGPAALVLYGVVIFALWKARRMHTHGTLAWLVVGPFLAAGAVSLVWQPVYLFRAFIGAAAPLCLLIGWALTEGVSPRLTAWAGAMLAPLLLLSLANRAPALLQATGENSRALEVVRAGWREGDIIVHGNVGSLSGFLVTAPDLPNYLLPVQPGSVGVLTPQTRAALGFCEGPLTVWAITADCGGRREVRPWYRAWLVWGASQTISGVEDQAIAALLEDFYADKYLDIHDVYHGAMPVDGGVWLLTPKPRP